MYKIKHIPTGLYYQPHKHRGSNISKRGKVYQTSTHGLSSAFRSAERHPNVAQRQTFSIFVQKDSPIHKQLKDVFVWEESYGWQMKAETNVSDWVIEKIGEDKIKQQIVAIISYNQEDFDHHIRHYLHDNNIPFQAVSNKIIETTEVRYYAVLNSLNFRGMSPDKVVETPRAYKSKEYGDIIDITKVYLPIGQKVEHEL